MKKLFLLLLAVFSISLSAYAQKTASGTVIDGGTGEPLVGATVMPVGGGNGVATDLNGHFTMKVPSSVTQVKVSYVGMEPQTVSVSENMKIALSADNTVLDEVVVTGYGSGKKLGSIVGSVNVVNSQVLEDTPVANFVDALQGQVPGLAIFSNSGEPAGVPSTIRIRGLNSLTAGNTPLFILDGAPVTSSVFTTLNPNDIESVTVLKDAASTAIYGSRAANGVIVITTKKGKYGEQARVSVRANVGWSQLADDNIDLMNSQEYIKFRDLVNVPVSDEVRNLVDRYGISTKWRDELVKNSALTYSIEGRVTGGSEKVRYYLSLAHFDQDGLIERSGISRETMRTNIDAKVNDWLSVGMSGNFGFESYETNAAASGNYYQNPFQMSNFYLPYDSPYYYSFDENGDIVYGERAKYYHYSGMIDPNYMGEKTLMGNRSNVSAMMNLYEQINPIKGLTIRAQQAMTAYDYRYSASMPPYPDVEVTPMGDVIDFRDETSFAQENFQRWYQFTYTNTAEYKFAIDDIHNISVLAGQESIITKNNSFGVKTTGQPNAQQYLLTQGTNVTMKGVSQSLYKTVINSYFLNASYDYDGRYFLDLNLRRDGSSKFADGHRWATFYAIGAMWNIKNEAFMQSIKWLSDLKLRANYGTTGNSSIDNYMYQGTVGSGSVYNGGSSMDIANMSNDNLTWETVRSFDVGFDAAIFENRLRASVDFYIKNTEDMLMEVPFSFTTGFTGGIANVGSMRNVGIDVELGADVYKSKDWYVGVDVNFNYNKNTITQLFNGLDEFTVPGTGVVYRVDENPYSISSVRFAGVDPRDGQQMWYDKDGNITKKYNEANQVNTGKTFIAPWNGGFGINARWKGISLRADFNWSAEKYIFNGTTYNFLNNPANTVGNNFNGSTELLTVWTKPGDITNIPNLYDLYGQPQSITADDRFVEDASFIRMKNLTVAYSLPKKWMQSLQIADITLHFTGRNLLTFTGFTGIDPEYEGNVIHAMYPNTRQYEFGLEVSF